MQYVTKYQSIVLMGKIASGKGTQADLILSHFGGSLYSNGNKVREAATQPSVFGNRIKEVYEGGYLIPEWVASYWMTHALIHQEEGEKIVFEAVAKKPEEAKMFDEIHTWIGRPYIVFHIDVSDDEVHTRSLKRSRDVVDSVKSVEKRLEEYNIYTAASIEIFRQKGVLVDIDGSQSEEQVKSQIFKHLTA